MKKYQTQDNFTGEALCPHPGTPTIVISYKNQLAYSLDCGQKLRLDSIRLSTRLDSTQLWYVIVISSFFIFFLDISISSMHKKKESK